VTAPFGLETEYDSTFIGRFQSKRAQVKTIDINPSVAFKLTDAVSLGAGISYQKMKVQLDRSTVIPAGAGVVEGMTQTRIEDEQWGFNLGAMFNLSTGTRIGITYRSAMDYDLDGTVLIGGIPLGGAVVGTTVQGATAPVKLPDTVSWGIVHQLAPNWELLGDLTWTRWSTIKTVPLSTTSASVLVPAGTTVDTFQFQFRDSYRVGIGANWKYSDMITLKFGTSYDRSPVVDTYRTPFLPDDNRFAVAFGAKFQFNKQATLDLGYMHLFISDGSINQQLGVLPTPVNGRFQGNLRGSYDSKANVFGAQASYSF
jgi:long-chain fatty acid transport protein